MEACSRSQRENFYDSIWDVSRRHILFTFARNSMFQLTTQKFFSSSCHLSCFDSKSSVPQASTLCRCHPINTHVRLTLPTARRPILKKDNSNNFRFCQFRLLSLRLASDSEFFKPLGCGDRYHLQAPTLFMCHRPCVPFFEFFFAHKSSPNRCYKTSIAGGINAWVLLLSLE